MSKFFFRKIRFPLGRLSEEFIEIYLDRYMIPVDAEVTLDGKPVTKSNQTPEVELASIFPDDTSWTRFRKASLFDGTIPIEPVTDSEEVLIAQSLSCGWPEQFILDIANPPEGMDAIFEGVEVLNSINE